MATETEQPTSIAESWSVEDVIDALYGFVGIYELDGTLISANRAALEAAGITRDDVLGKKFWNTYWWSYDPDVQATLKSAMARAARGEKVRYEAPVRMKEDHVITIDVMFGPLMNSAGKQTHIVGSAVDVTERIAALNKLKRSERNLADAQRLANIGSWQLEMPTNQLTWSDHVYRIFEIDPDQFDASYESFLDAIHPDDRDEVDRVYRISLAERMPYRIEHRLLMKDGRVKFVVENGKTFYKDDGTPFRSLGTVQDITARRTMEDELRASKERAEEASKAKSEFLSCMSHELRTPLNAILGFAQLLKIKSSEALSAESAAYVDDIAQAGAHLLGLVTDILELSRIEAGSVKIQLESVSLGEAIADATSLVRSDCADRQIALHLSETIGTAERIAADPMRLRQVLINLLSNGIKYNAAGGAIHIEVQDVGGDLLRISISDEGPGIPVDRQDELFEPFNRLNFEKSGIDGVGIGLAISKGLVEMMGGSIGVESCEGQGSTFWVEFMKATAEDSALRGSTLSTHEPPARFLQYGMLGAAGPKG